MTVPVRDIAARAAAHRDDVTRFLRDLIAIPSPSCGEADVVARIRAEMERCGFDEVKVDGMGNVLGRVGSGRTVLAFDAHIDTVGVGDPDLWKIDPYRGALENGVIYGRGASDQKAGMAALVWGMQVLREAAVAHDCTIWVVGSVMEEDCDGLCWQYIIREGVLQPDFVVLTEPTDLTVYRGHRGRMELNVVTKGVSCHGSAPERGVNAVYKMAPILADVEALNGRLRPDDFLGKGSVTVSEIRSTSPSLCAVADSCTIHLDRRLTAGETLASAVAEIEALPSVRRAEARVVVLDYAATSWTGLVYPTQKYYPTWVLPEAHPLCTAALAATEALWSERRTGKWTFSTNGVATMGLLGVPTVGFGPAVEVHAHAPTDQCPVDHLVKAMMFYAALPAALAGAPRGAVR